MNSKILKTYRLQSKSFTYFILICIFILGCISKKKLHEETTILEKDQKSERSISSDKTEATTSAKYFGLDNHLGIWQKTYVTTPVISNTNDSLTQVNKIIEDREISSQDVLVKEFEIPNYLEIKSPVAAKIIENYVKSKNKEPGGHCLAVSKGRFDKAYEEVHGHSFYEDLPSSMATKHYTSRQVFDYLYVSASGVHDGWLTLPKEYRGKGNAGAITYAGFGALVDSFGIWTGKLRPGSPMQVWKRRKDYEKVIQGVNNKNFDPFGHSFIFISYLLDDKNEIIGIRIADQGYQSYRPLVPNDYEVWWAVNLNN